MAEGVVSFGVQKLCDLLIQESERLQGVDEQVDELKRQIRMLQSLLEDANAKKHEGKSVGIFLEDIKDIVDDAEDIIESFLLKEVKEKGIKKRVKRFSCFLVERRKFHTNIEGIIERISTLIAEMQNFGIIKKIDGGCSLSLQERQKKFRLTFAKSSEKGLVGVEQSVEKLVGQLVENDNIRVVSISGMSGIGKTTLARQVFHHDIVRRHFDGFAWVCVSQEFTRKDIWQMILQDLLDSISFRKNPDLKQHDGNIKKMDERTLQAKLFKLLETSRYLIVLDDVWKKEDWDLIKDVFPQKGDWRMILTSRNEGIIGLHAYPKCFAFRPKMLTPDESWNLLASMVFQRRDETEFNADEKLEAVGRKMVADCGGLPLAVVGLGGLLEHKYTVPEWNKVYENMKSQVVGNSGFDNNKPSLVYRVLSLSYEDLPTQLKQCFLYLAHFPEDSKIDLKKLYHYWAAEGIITSVCNGATIRENGEGYLEELVRRNMVLVEKGDLRWSWGYCQMHDIMREICLSKAKEENFLQVIKSTTSSSTINVHTPTRSRRLVVQGGDALHMLGRKEYQKARCVLCFGLEGNLSKQSAQRLRNLQFLRVLDLSRAHSFEFEFEGGVLPSNIGELIHLRFLSLEMAEVSHLPSSLKNLKRLLYLNLFTFGITHMPNIFKEMVELRYLSLPHSIETKAKLELGNLVNLEHLWCFSMKHGNVTDLLRMTRLRSLYVILDDQDTSETLQSSLSGLENLETLHLRDWNQSDGKAYQVDFVWDFNHLRNLQLDLHMPRFPDQHRFPPHLANISLQYCRMMEDPLPILEKLLHLKSVKLSSDVYVGWIMVCSKGGFPQLCKLEISFLNELVVWIVEKGSMPCLRSLKISNCKKLELPYGLECITSLKELDIERMNKDWKKKLSPGGESYYKVQHIPNVQFRNCNHE